MTTQIQNGDYLETWDGEPNADGSRLISSLIHRPLPEVDPVNAWWIYVGPFYDRFGDHKLSILASADPMVGALIKDCSVRKYIDLKRADLPGALDLLLAKGFAINKTAILSTPVPESERFVG